MTFELWHPFATAMERALLLRDLRERGDLPPAFEQAHPVAARLIRWLMAANPAQRPTAAEVLRSQLLPPQVGEGGGGGGGAPPRCVGQGGRGGTRAQSPHLLLAKR
jgi:hypothetical protein